jgi:hypothetical protein
VIKSSQTPLTGKHTPSTILQFLNRIFKDLRPLSPLLGRKVGFSFSISFKSGFSIIILVITFLGCDSSRYNAYIHTYLYYMGFSFFFFLLSKKKGHWTEHTHKRKRYILYSCKAYKKKKSKGNVRTYTNKVVQIIIRRENRHLSLNNKCKKKKSVSYKKKREKEKTYYPPRKTCK